MGDCSAAGQERRVTLSFGNPTGCRGFLGTSSVPGIMGLYEEDTTLVCKELVIYCENEQTFPNNENTNGTIRRVQSVVKEERELCSMSVCWCICTGGGNKELRKRAISKIL